MPQEDDAINLATIRWYALTLEKLLIEMYSTNRKKLPVLQKLLDEDLKELRKHFKKLDFDREDEDECPPGQKMCSDGFCKPECDDVG
jgi:hypothetical protein